MCKKIVKVKIKESLNYIDNGAIDFYFGLRIETKLNFEELCANICKRVDESFENYDNYIKALFQENMEKVIRESGLENKLHIKDPDKSKIMAKFNDLSEQNDEICSIEFDITDNGFKFTPYTKVNNYLAQMRVESNFDYDYSKEVYGDFYINSQTRFILPPIKIELKNGLSALLSAVLVVFKNNTAVLRMTLPIDDMDSKPLMLNDIDNYILSAKTLYGFPLQLKDESIEAIKACYCQFLAGTNDVNAVVCFKKIVNIMLANHSCMVNNIKDIPDKIKEDIYRISIAPVQERKDVSYVDEAKKHFDKNGYFFNGIGYILSSMGKCVSVIDNTVVEFIKDNFATEQVFSKIINDLRRNVEFTIIILLLKNINDSYTFEQNGFENSKLGKVKKDYNKNKIFVSLLQSNVYGSVRDLTSMFEESMMFFLDSKNVEDRMIALDNILEEEQSRRTLQLQNVISIVGLIFTIIFGLPAINETLLHIRTLCFFIKEDINFMTVENCSFLIWLLTIIGLSLFIFYKSKKMK